MIITMCLWRDAQLDGGNANDGSAANAGLHTVLGLRTSPVGSLRSYTVSAERCHNPRPPNRARMPAHMKRVQVQPMPPPYVQRLCGGRVYP